QRAAADAGDRLFHLAADGRGEPFRARTNPRRLLMQHSQDRHLTQLALGLEVEQQRSLERGETELVDPEGPVQWMPAQALDELSTAGHDAGLRAAEELVAAEAHEVGTARERLPRGRLVGDVDQRARAEV